MTTNDSLARASRRAGRAELATLLADARSRTLRTFDAFVAELGGGGMAVPYAPEINPPCWELGHIGWFHEWWLRRNPERARGVAADPDAPRLAPHRAGDDARFDSGRVPHRRRWTLALPNLAALREGLAREQSDTRALLADAGDDDAALYFFRLCLFHEDMHHEAAVYMAQRLDVPLAGWTPRAHPAGGELRVEGALHRSGEAPEAGFAFDNELGVHDRPLGAFRIDAAPVTWAQFLPFVEAGGYGRPEHWSAAGQAWLGQRHAAVAAHAAHAARAGEPRLLVTTEVLPQVLRRLGRHWQRLAFGRWIDLDPALPALHLSCHEAEAWCAWAGRRLPSEAEWEQAAESAGSAFAWGQVWEWTASRFGPYPGFVAHPYRDYSAPWFETRRVLRGGSFATTGRMKHVRYRNFYTPDRSDIFAGFRSCAAVTP